MITQMTENNALRLSAIYEASALDAAIATRMAKVDAAIATRMAEKALRLAATDPLGIGEFLRLEWRDLLYSSAYYLRKIADWIDPV
jgi:hypothetical protein